MKYENLCSFEHSISRYHSFYEILCKVCKVNLHKITMKLKNKKHLERTTGILQHTKMTINVTLIIGKHVTF